MALYLQTADDIAFSPALLIASQFFSFGIPYFIYLALNDWKIHDSFMLKRPRLPETALVLVMCIFLTPFMMLLSGLMALFFDNPVAELLADFKEQPLLLIVFTAAAVPAVFEEIIFRGIFLMNCMRINIKTAIFLNGLFFGLIHFNIQQFPYAFTLGLVFALFVLNTGSIFTSIIAHFFINASQVFMDYLFRSDVSKADAYAAGDLLPVLIAAVIGVAVCAPLYILFVKTCENARRRSVYES